MVTHNDIGWGRYKNFEGPFYKGKHAFVLSPNATSDEKILAVITATEGGRYDAWNGYDVCGWTSGLIQWCEGRGQYSVSDMLGAVYMSNPALLKPVLDYSLSVGVTFVQDARKRWRFSFLDIRGVVDRQEEQDQLFYMQGDGTVGSWTVKTTLYAKKWAAAISSVWESEDAQRVQKKYTVDRLRKFMLPYAKSVFDQAPATAEAMALEAAYLSFAANNPTWADKALRSAVDMHPIAWDLNWVTAVLRSLTFNPMIAIYPHRYDAIRPVLEKLYGLNLPDFSNDLKSWSAYTGIPANVTTVNIQEALIRLGYDLGPSGADGKYGRKTKEAVLAFEHQAGIALKAQDGMVDNHTWPALQAALAARKLPPVV